jgi:hypothetical protein
MIDCTKEEKKKTSVKRKEKKETCNFIVHEKIKRCVGRIGEANTSW